MTINYSPSEDLNLPSGLTINDDLTVNAPNATVNNNATVSGTINIKDVKAGTWNELVSVNTLVFDAKGKTLNLPEGVAGLTINANATVITPKLVQATVAEGITVTVKGSPEDNGREYTGTAGGGKIELDPAPEAPKSNDVSINDVKVAEVAAEVNTEDATKYTVTVPYGTELTEELLTLTLAEGATKEVTLADNVYTVVVTAEDGETTKTYTITVTIAEAAKYTVSFSVIGDNGTLEATVDSEAINSGAGVEERKTVVFTATPATGYRVKGWTIDGVAVADNTTNILTIENLDASKTVAVEFELIPVTKDVTDEAELRSALLNKVDVINLKADITITSGTPHIYGSVTINGNGHSINGSNGIDSQDAALYIVPENKGDVIITNIKLKDGSILVASDFEGSLTVKDSEFNGKYGVFACNGKVSAQNNTFTGERGLTLEAPTKIGKITGNTFNVSVRGISYRSTDVPAGYDNKEAYVKYLMEKNEFGENLVEDIQKVKWQY